MITVQRGLRRRPRVLWGAGLGLLLSFLLCILIASSSHSPVLERLALLGMGMILLCLLVLRSLSSGYDIERPVIDPVDPIYETRGPRMWEEYERDRKDRR